MYKKLYKYAKFIFLAVVVITLSLISAFGAIQSTDTLSNEVYAAAPQGTASILNLNNKGGYIDNFTGALQGGQEEYIYFGKNGTDPIVWRVLSTNDTKYSNGGILLWADEQIGTGQYNEEYANTQEHAFWGTSKMRAMLNGGNRMYVKDAAGNMTGTVTDAQSWLFKIFDTDERGCVEPTGNYDTIAWGYRATGTVTADYYHFTTTDMTGGGDGKYDTSKFGQSGYAEYAKVGADNSVVETTAGDYLFLLDYHDINNPLFGFVDKNDKTYADNVMKNAGGWNDTGTKRGYPGYYDYNSQAGAGLMPDSVKASSHYWLRPAGRYKAGSYALIVNSSGYVSFTNVNDTRGVRPGFIFNPESLIYATASNDGNSDTFSLVTDRNNLAGYNNANKPTYKIFMQSATDYVNYNEKPTGAPTVMVSGDTVKVKKPGQAGKAVILLTDKEGSGVVSYQATADFNGGVATATLGGVNANNYSVTVLFLDKINGGNSVEKVTASYTGCSLAIPQDCSIEYLGRDIVVDDFANEEWYDADIYKDNTKIKVDLSGVKDVKENGYTVTFTLLDAELNWSDGTQEAKSITLTITEAPLSLQLKSDSSPPEWEVKSGLLGGDSPPDIKIYYKGRGSTTYPESTTKPTSKGTYTATAKIDAGGNYKLDNTYTKDFEILATPLKVPALENTTIPDYNGSDQNFVILNYDSKYMSHTIVDNKGTFDGTSSTFTAKNAGDYEIRFTITDAEYCWEGGSTTYKAVKIKINKKDISVQFGCDGDSWQWPLDTTKNVWVTHNGEIASDKDKVEFVFNYGQNDLTATTVDYKASVTIPKISQGDYTLSVKLAESNATNANANYNLTGTTTRAFKITGKDATFKESDLKWQYENNGTVKDITDASNFKVTYNGFAFKLSINDSNLAALGVKVKEGSLRNNIYTDARKYTTEVTIEALNTSIVFTEKKCTISWEIEKADIDVSKVKWNYDSANPFVYTRENGVAKTFKVELTGLPKELEGKITYTNTTSASSQGSYTATFSVNINTDNYNTPTFNIPTTLSWKINPHTITKPNAPSDLAFDDEVHDIATLFGLLSDWDQYLSATIKNGSTTVDSIKDAGKYRVTFEFLSAVGDNAEWSDGDSLYLSLNFEVTKKQLQFTGWSKNPPIPQFEGNVADKYYEVIYKDSKGNVITREEASKLYGETCTVTVKVPDSIGNNVEIKDTNGVGFTKTFTIHDGPPEILEKPTLTQDKFVYNGNEVDISQYLQGFDEKFMAKSGDILLTNAGNYKLTISIPETVNAEWDDGTTDDIIFEWSIAKATINVEWDTKGKTPVLKLDGALADAVEYVFYDNGVEIAKDNLVNGKSYTVKAKLKDEYAVNYMFSETESELTNAKTFKFNIDAVDGGDNNSGNGGTIALPENFPLWQIIVGSLAILLGIVFYVRTISNVRKTRQYKKDTEKVNNSYAEDNDKNEKLYSFVGLPILLAGMYLGLEQNMWTTIACICVGVCVLGFVLMLTTGRICNNAKTAYESAVDAKNAELARRRDEKQRQNEERFREEQRRRDEEMKMMFMAMMNRGAGMADDQTGYTQVYQPYDNVEEIVTRVVTALLPTMQALPASSSEATNKQLEKLTKILEKQSSTLEQQSQTLEQQNESMEMQSSIIEQQSKVIEELQYKMYNEDYDDEDEWVEDEEEDFYEPDDDDDDDAELFVTDDVPMGKRVHVPSNFRIRMKLGSDKNRNAYAVIKNKLGSFKKVSFRICGRIEKVMYKGEPLMYIGVVRKSLKLWLALNPNEFDSKRYFQRDASDKVRYQKVPMLVRVGSDRALKRAEELIEILAAQYGLELRRKYTEKSLQELAYTLKGNALVKDKMPELLREVIHTHDADILTNEDAERFIETREKLYQAEENFATISIDVLEENFYDGQKVTLEKLQKKGLVAEECNGYRLTAGERLTKPLYVVADEFAPTAVKMIVLTGGRAIRLTEQVEQKFI